MFVWIFDEATREPSNTLLDVILKNSPSVITKHGVLAPICSDHKPIYACLNFTNHKIASYKRTAWDFKSANFDNFRDKLSRINWDFINVNDDIDLITDIFTEKFIGAAKATLPNKRGKDKPWMHNEIRKQIRIRRRIHRYAKRINSPEYWQKYRVLRNKVTSLVRKSKDEYYKRLTDNINTDHNKSSKSWWRLCKFHYTGKTNQHTIPPIIINGRVLTKDTDKAKAFNEYFTSISKIDNADSEPPDDLNVCISSLEHIYITRRDVLDIIKSLKLNIACGFDLITHTLLKESIDTLSLPLSTLFNKSLSICRFPENGKWQTLLLSLRVKIQIYLVIIVQYLY